VTVTTETGEHNDVCEVGPASSLRGVATAHWVHTPQVAGVAEQTIKMSYDDMYPHRAALFSNLPRAFMERLPANFDAMLPKPRESPALAGSPLLALASGLPAAAAPVPALTGSQLG
jgi:hypothetical protein